MELIAKINPEDKINLQFVREDRDYFYNRLYQDISVKVLERIETDVRNVVGREIGSLLESIMKKYMETAITNIHNTVSTNISLKLDSIIEQEKHRIKRIPFLVEYKYRIGKPFSKELEAEEYLISLYKLAGYQCYRSKDYFLKEKIPYKIYSDAIEDSYGIPDLIVWNDKEAFFVEVKLFSGSISGNQLVWYTSHPDVISIICFVGNEHEIKTVKTEISN